MKVLLTGAAGFIGRHIAEAATAAGHEVIGVDMLLQQAHGTTAKLPPGVVHGDIRDPALLDELLADVDVVCHQAATVGNGVDAQDLPGYAAHNDLGTATLLAAMARTGTKRLVLASSMVVYGEGRYTCPDDGDVPPAPRQDRDLQQGLFDPRCPHCGGRIEPHLIGEDAVFAPRTAYAASKIAQEHYAAAWCTLESGSAIALRYHNAYGPGMPADTPYSGVAAIFRSALERGEPPQVFEDGNQLRDFVHVVDLARANVAAIEAVGAHRPGLSAYNICSGHTYTIGDMARRLATVMGGPKPVVNGQYRAFDVRHIAASPRAALEGLGFEAGIGPDEGIAELATAPLRGR
ncbi:NAD-dependent epimerase/dehydratase family protein [Brevibacterium marinum]|uniref:dTDP-L-rhamnose 4-epimerase n=1 Tax=Brevibacterium marinum TaxID=418643 RepID=A0A846RZW9_9MICO|nr:NAD-dependent epimerase/dehydratase family protein [Brevibacterium marinum]NJC56388.1 dTDP-L-rhamnose 4-epimerase [Brevibacterium marinum]